MKAVLSILALVTAGICGWFAALETRTTPRQVERSHIYGFHIVHRERPFWDYVPPIASEGLREIRSERLPKAVVATVISPTSAAAAYTLTATSTTGAWATCQNSPTITYARWP